MKIFFFINSLHTAGGTERVTTILANLLVNEGYEIGIVCLHGGGSPFFQLSPRINLYYINSAGYKNIYIYYLLNIYKVRRLFKDLHPNFVVDVCSAMSLISIPAAWKRITNIITWEHFNSNVDWNPVTTPFSRKLATIYSYKIVTLTRQDALNYGIRYKAKNVLVIPNPITIEHSIASPLKNKIVLAVGRFTFQKGFDLLLEIWNKVQERKDGWLLRIVGSGEMEPLMKNMIKRLGLSQSVEILPPTNNILEEYHNASIYAMSSRFEGLPLVLIEAMSIGLPIISFDCETGPKDIVIHNKTGFLVKPCDIDLFAKKLDELMKDENKRSFFSENALIESVRFEPREIVRCWCDLFNEIS